MKSIVIGLLIVGTVLALLLSLRRAQAAAVKDGAVKHVDAAGAEKLIAEKAVVVLDLRTPSEFAAGHIAGAINLDFLAADFAKRLGELDKSKTYLVHCASGNRSTRALPACKQQKLSSVVHLDGGIKAWQRAGKPVEK